MCKLYTTVPISTDDGVETLTIYMIDEDSEVDALEEMTQEQLLDMCCTGRKADAPSAKTEFSICGHFLTMSRVAYLD